MQGSFIFHHLLLLAQTFYEAKGIAITSCGTTRVESVSIPMSSTNNSNFCIIPARHPHHSEDVRVLVSPEDYDKIVAIAPKWRVSSSGYIITAKRSEGKNKVTYLHKEVFGGTCTHLNGDRYDNRRSNLSGSKKRRRPADMDIHSILDLIDNPSIYPDGKQFHGERERGEIPHGFGFLVESKKRSLGWWEHGRFISGIIMDLTPVPLVMMDCVQVFHPVQHAVLIHNNKCIKTTR